MKLPRREFLQLAGLAAALSAGARAALAQAYPTRPVRWIVPFPPGGTTDVIARLMGEWLAGRLGQPVIVENKPGGGTNIGVQAVVNAPADGYTLLFAVATNAINASLYQTLPFDFRRDIAPVAGLCELPLVLEVNPSVPARTVAEFIAYAKANPGKINIASFGVGTISHLAIELFKATTGVDIVHVPYRGGPQIITDLLAGQVQAGVDALPNSLPHIRSGAVRALAILPAARTAPLPGVPTVGETVPGFEVSAWSGVGVPTGTPADIVDRLNAEINAGLANPGIRARLADVGATPLQFTPAEFRAMIARDVEKWAKVVKLAGVKLN
ncbi:MAG: Bug family tripartite tricarboxylate transporter substrate binding protein [Xanthobacteraceae bacterium]